MVKIILIIVIASGGVNARVHRVDSVEWFSALGPSPQVVEEAFKSCHKNAERVTEMGATVVAWCSVNNE